MNPTNKVLENFTTRVMNETSHNREVRFFNKRSNGSKEILSETETNKKIKKLLKEKIKEHLKTIHVKNSELRKASAILDRCLRYCNLTEKSLLKVGNIKKVLRAIENIEIFGSAPPIAKDAQAVEGENAKNFLKYLFSDLDLSFKWISRKFVSALVFSKSEKLLGELREELQDYFIGLADKLNTKQYGDPHSQKLAETVIANALSLFPFFEPEDGSSIQVPRKIDGKWVLVDYTVNTIQMTPDWMGDPYFAYGLKSNGDVQAPPLLVFMGTPPPTTKGALIAEWTDVVPGYSVGETVYRMGKEKIEDFLHSSGSENCEVMGQSLGGSLSLIYASDHPEKVSKVFSFNPPAPWPSTLKKWKKNTKDKDSDSLPKVNVFRQEKDFASILGAGWDKNWNVYRVLTEKTTNPYESHIRAFSGQKNVVVWKMDVKADNRSLARRILRVVFEFLRVPFFVVKSTLLGGRIIGIAAKNAAMYISRLVLPKLFTDPLVAESHS